MMMKQIRRVLLVDDHRLVRAGIRSLLESMLLINEVMEAGEGIEALDLVRRYQPQVVLLDITLSGMNGLDVCEQIKQKSPTTQVLFLSMHASVEYVAKAMQVGATGYLIKDAAYDELEIALKTTLRGQRYISREIPQDQVDKLLQKTGLQDITGLALLTLRQKQILQLICEGLGPSDIAQRLNLSVKTIESHRAAIMARLDIHNVPGLVRFAIRNNLIES